MSDSERYAQGARSLERVYANAVPAPPEGSSDFMDLMVRHVFGEVWTRDGLSVRDRRLLVMGVIAGRGAADVWRIQAASALANGELDAHALRECIIQLAPYAGYPAISGLVQVTEQVIAEHAKEKA
ncbi:MAG: carboxymuconolactone decarboxylase family protein [Myxococcota bacterium]